MIIQDGPNHKIDATYDAKGGFLHITAFSRVHADSFDWNTKVIGLSPEVQKALVNMIIEQSERLPTV